MRTDGGRGSDLPLAVRRSLAAHSLWIESDGRKGARADLRNHDLRDLDLSGAELSGADLSGADLRGARLDRGRFRLACVDGADLGQAVFDRACVLSTRFDTIDIVAGNGTAVRGARAARLTGARFRRSAIHGCSFRGADLDGVSFAGADLADCDFAGARMSAETAALTRLATRLATRGAPPETPAPEGPAGRRFTDLGRPPARP